MRELGAIMGLSIGYIVKFNLDRRFVFADTRPETDACEVAKATMRYRTEEEIAPFPPYHIVHPGLVLERAIVLNQ